MFHFGLTWGGNDDATSQRAILQFFPDFLIVHASLCNTCPSLKYLGQFVIRIAHGLLNTRPYMSQLKAKIKWPVFQKNSTK